MLLHDYLTTSARRYPEKTALRCGTSSYTYAALQRSALAFARFLQGKGLQKGDRVAIYLENSMETVVAIFGTWMAGGCVVNIGAIVPQERVGALRQHSGSRFLVTFATRIPRFSALSGQEVLHLIAVGDGAIGPETTHFEEIIASAHPPAAVAESEGSGGSGVLRRPLVDVDLAAIIYTSGTTGKSKGVTHTHRSIDTAVETIVEYLDNNADDVILCVLQLNFSYGLVQLLATFRTGATLILEKGYGYPYEIVRLIERHRVTGFAGTPTIWSLLLNLPSLSAVADADAGTGVPALASVRYITNAAAGLPATFIPRLKAVIPRAKIFLMHGQTECIRTTFLPPEEVRQKPTAVGKGMRNVELWIEDDDGNRLGPGEIGEMVVRGSVVMAGYWNDPEATSRALFPGEYSWERVLHTNDLFRMDADGYFHFVSRNDEIIKSRGEKVSPFEVEGVIYRLDEVAECRVIGVPDEILGHAIRAEIVIKPGHVCNERKIKAHCAGFLEPYKIPTQIVTVEAIPKTASGKIRRAQPGS
jgi:long-chain acyl-CoA synthetase